MLTYFYIALGGAIGSVARAWTTTAMIRAAGAQFPWGTILINIVGSFIIGLFGALTASDGRFTVHADARAFVMVGICGGYTTFSAFSLQTLDLLRDGKPAAALANVALSIVLCLLAVTAGHTTATLFNAQAAKTQVAPAAAVGQVAVAVLDQPERVAGLLSSADGLLRYLGGGRIDALAVRTPPFADAMSADLPLTPIEEAHLRAAQQAWGREVGSIVARWQTKAKSKDLSTELIDVEGDIGTLVAEYGRQANMVVVNGAAQDSRRSRDALHAAIFDTSRPVLVVPPNFNGAFGRVVAVAWKADARAPKAVLAAMPILTKAEQVHVLHANVSGAEFRMPELLTGRGLRVYLHAFPPQGRPVGQGLLNLACELGADLIVMGAYAHGEWREALLGGVTRYMLDHSTLPLFMQH